VRDILGDDAGRGQEGKLRFDKRDAMLSLVLRVLGGSHSKLGFTVKSIAEVWVLRHTQIWAPTLEQADL